MPTDLQSEKRIDGVFLVMWNQINTIMHYPDREGYDFPSEFDKNIGFKKDELLIMLNGNNQSMESRPRLGIWCQGMMVKIIFLILKIFASRSACKYWF